MFATLLNSSIFALFIIIALGFVLGRIKIRGINLDVSAVIFVALLFGHFGVVIPAELGNFGMALFIFSIGIQAGPGFFSTFRSKGKTLAVISAVLVCSAAAVAILSAWIFNFTGADAAGLLAGSLTSTPGLATAKEVAGDSAAISYSIAYPFGMIGVILLVKLLPTILKINLKDEEKRIEESNRRLYPEVVAGSFRVTNELVLGKTLSDLCIRSITGAVISRIVRGTDSIIPTGTDVLLEGDLIKAVGTGDSLGKLEQFLGEAIPGELPFTNDIELQTALVTSRGILGRTLGNLNLHSNFGCTVTRIRRSGIDLSPDPTISLKFGDKLTIVGHKENMKEIFALVGNQRKLISDTDFFPIALGIVLGVVLGNVSISFSDSFSFSLGLTGGILLTALLLSAIGKTGGIIWTMSSSANQLLRQLGLLLFLANVGSSAGAGLVSTFLGSGWMLFVAGIFITLIPMIVATIVARSFYKINMMELLGTLTGGMTSTPGLAAADSMCSSTATSVAYATVYPVAMVLLIILTQIVANVV